MQAAGIASAAALRLSSESWEEMMRPQRIL